MSIQFEREFIQVVAQIRQPFGALDNTVKIVAMDNPQAFSIGQTMDSIFYNFNTTKLMTNEKEYLITQTLKQMGESLSGVPEFMRVHRSFIVNLSQVEEIGDLFVLISQKQIPLNKSSKDELATRLQKIWEPFTFFVSPSYRFCNFLKFEPKNRH